MGNEIKTSGLATSILAAELKREVEDYCSLRLLAIYGAAPVTGSADHDGRITSLANEALASFARVVNADVATVQSVEAAFEGADKRAPVGIAAR